MHFIWTLRPEALPDSYKLCRIYPVHTSITALTILYQNDLLTFHLSYPALTVADILLIYVFPETIAVLYRANSAIYQSHEHRNKCSFQPLNILPESQHREEKRTKIFKVGQAWVCHPIIIHPWVFSFNLLHRVVVI